VSVKIEAAVWERARAKGSNLLALVKIADWTLDEGRDCFVGAKGLAKALRMTERAARLVLHKLEEDREILIEPNTARRSLTIGKRTFVPDWFIHVRCVCEWEAYQTEGNAEKISSSRFPGRRPRVSANAEKISESPEPGGDPDAEEFSADTEKISASSEKISANAEKTGTAYKEGSVIDPVRDPVSEVQAVAPPPPPAADDDKSDDDDPAKNLGVLTALAHDTLDLYPPTVDLAEVTDALKWRCSQLHIASTPDLIRQAIDSARHQRALVGKR
jgi:hypothetical protein